MKIRKRIISIMLTVFMMASIMPNLIVSAEEATSELQNIYYKLTVDKKAKIGYIGGSITQGYLATTPWPTLLGDWFGENFKDAEITNVNAGIGGTGSMFGAYRAYRDLKIAEGAPDMVFIEFAMNDLYLNMDEANTKRYYESIIQRIYAANSKCQIISLFTTDFNTKGGNCDNRTWQKEIADYYGIKTIDIGQYLWDKIVAENGSEPANLSNATWVTYFNDYVHPKDAGHAVYAEKIEEYLSEQLIGDTVTRDNTTYKDLSKTAKGTDLITDGMSANFTEAEFYKEYTPGWILKAANSEVANISNDILAYAGNAKLAFEFTGTSAGFYNESIGTDGNVTYKVTKKSDGSTVSEGTVNVNGRALTMFAQNLTSDTYRVEIVSDVNRRFRYVVYSGSSLEICKDTESTELIAQDKAFGGNFDNVANMTQTSTTYGGKNVYLLEADSTKTTVPYGQRWALNGNNIFIPDYRYVKISYYLEVPEGTESTPQIGINFTASPVDSGSGESSASAIVTKDAKTNMWATMVIDVKNEASSILAANPLNTNVRRYYLYPFGNLKANEVPAGTKVYIESVTWMTNYVSQEGDVNLSFVSGFADVQGTAPSTIKADTSTPITLPENPFSKEGYEFVGWGIDGTIYQPGEKFAVEVKGDYTANALWKKTGEETTQKVAYVSTLGYIDSDNNGQSDLVCYNSITNAYEYFAEVGGDDTGIIYISGAVNLPDDTSAERGKVLIRGMGDTSEDIANNKLTPGANIKLLNDITFDYLTLTDFGSKTVSSNGNKLTFGEHLKSNASFNIESDIPYLAAENKKIINAPKITFGAPDVTYGWVSATKNGTVGDVNGTAEYTFNAGTFGGNVIAGSWLWATSGHAINLAYNANYVFNGGKFNDSIYLGSRYEVGIQGNVVFTVNGGSFTSGKTMSFGHTTSGNGFDGYKGVKNSAIVFNNKQINLNGGSVKGLKVDHKTGATEMKAEGAEIVIINNAEIENGLVLSSDLASTHRIKVMNGSAVPVFKDETGGELLGFKITADNPLSNSVCLNDAEILPDENGLYTISADTTAGDAGIRTVTFKQNIFAVVDGEEIPATEKDGEYVIEITKDGAIDLSDACCADKEGAYFIGWKNESGKYVVTNDNVTAGDTLKAVYIGADALTISASVVTSPSNAIRYSSSIDADAMKALNEINNVGKGEFAAPSDNGIGYGTIIIKSENMATGTELTKETAGASVIPAEAIQENSYYADSEAIADKDIENNMFTARSYITYKDTLGQTHTIYSDALNKTLYQVAAADYVNEATSETTKQYLLENILDVASRLENPFSNTAKVIQRDKKLTIGYIGGSITNGYSAGTPIIRLNDPSTGKFKARWADGTEIDANDPRLDELGGLTIEWYNWNLHGMPMYYDENGVKYTKDNADLQECTWDATTGTYVGGDYFKVLPSDISKNWVNRINGWFEEKFPDTEIESVNVGISGTPSSYGAARIETDLLYSDGHDVPDLVFIEFTVNDWLYTENDNTDGLSQTNDDLMRQVESMLLSIWKANPYAEIALIYTAGENAPTSKLHTQVANHYNIPYSDVGTRMGALKAERLSKIDPSRTWESSSNKDLYYTTDNLHPSVLGYGLYFEDIKEDLLDKYITNDMTYGTTLYNYGEAHKDLEPVTDWSMLNPTHILAEDFTWTGTEGEEMPYTENMWGMAGNAWSSTADCEYDYQKAPGVPASIYYTARNNSSTNFLETPSSVHVTSDKAEASFTFTGRAFGFLFKTMYHNIDMNYRVDGGEWKKFRVAGDNKFASILYENSNFIMVEQNLEQGSHTVEMEFVKSGGRINPNFQYVTADTNEVNIFLGSAVYFNDTDAAQADVEITDITNISQTGLNVQLVEPEKDNAQVILAVYNKDGAPSSVTVKEVSGSNIRFDVAIPQEDGITVKAMLWEDLEKINPLCDAKSAEMTSGEWIVK